MRVLFIRHAKALSRQEWQDDDLLRPLSNEGIQKAKDLFAKLPKIYDIDIIISSKAIRAIQTAKILEENYPNIKYFETSRLNPGATIMDIEFLIEKFRGYSNIALIGHEPDFSLAISHLVGCDNLQLRVKKASVIELDGEEHFALAGIIYPKMLRKLH
ncbi:histidine phosphatase family protein [Nitratiruptor sp. YY09-18]|uniref:SixA phosphatase family protein n=1 Tax=Nitratiruptor sp. YY09-18 TaxID=2724901 RepID=UPI0019159613|nr:histidine phosphatase family protein [Nitratiruptor sp. YY09-18]BCD67853.1 phosphohistidine phosphatase [Nitratiruptor sp. YY09-18]